MPRCPAWCGHRIIREMGHHPGAEMGLVCPKGWGRLPAPAFIHSMVLRRHPWLPLISPFKWSSPVRDVLRVNVKKIIPEEARSIYESTISNISALFTTIDSVFLLQILKVKIHSLAKKRTEALEVFVLKKKFFFFFGGDLGHGWKFWSHTRIYDYGITLPVPRDKKCCRDASRELPFQFKRIIACELSDNISIII